MRRSTVILAVLAALLAGAPAAAAAAPGPSVTSEPGARFPVRRFVISLPLGTAPYEVRVSENGTPVQPHLTPITSRRSPLSLAILLDTSASMHGRPLRAAVDAAETLIQAKPARSDVAVFGFAHEPYTIHGWSASRYAFRGALDAVRPSVGTALWDAVTNASQLVAERPGASRAIVLLTDGRDTSSSASASTAIAAARASRARVFAVALPGANVDRGDLRRIVSATKGQLVTVSSVSQLHAVYADLAKRLRQQYVLSYVSQLRGAGRAVRVRVSAGGASTVVPYTIPAAATAAGHARSPWDSSARILVVGAGVGLLILLAAYLILRPRPASATRRVGGYVPGGKEPRRQAEIVPVLPMRGSPSRLGAMLARFRADVERGRIPMSPGRLLAAGAFAGLLLGLVLAAFTGITYGMLGGPVIGLLAVWGYVRHRAEGWHRHFDATLPDSLAVLASSLRAGHSLLQAISHVAEEASDQTAREWEEVVRRTRLGVAIEDALEEMTSRIASRDLQWISLVARVQHQVGGNMAEMFDIVSETVRERQRLRAQLHALTAQGRMTRWILTLAPVVLAGAMFLLSPDYMLGFFQDPRGRVLCVVAVVLSVAGSLWIKKVIEIDT